MRPHVSTSAGHRTLQRCRQPWSFNLCAKRQQAPAWRRTGSHRWNRWNRGTGILGWRRGGFFIQQQHRHEPSRQRGRRGRFPRRFGENRRLAILKMGTRRHLMVIACVTLGLPDEQRRSTGSILSMFQRRATPDLGPAAQWGRTMRKAQYTFQADKVRMSPELRQPMR